MFLTPSRLIAIIPALLTLGPFVSTASSQTLDMQIFSGDSSVGGDHADACAAVRSANGRRVSRDSHQLHSRTVWRGRERNVPGRREFDHHQFGRSRLRDNAPIDRQRNCRNIQRDCD